MAYVSVNAAREGANLRVLRSNEKPAKINGSDDLKRKEEGNKLRRDGFVVVESNSKIALGDQQSATGGRVRVTYNESGQKEGQTLESDNVVLEK